MPDRLSHAEVLGRYCGTFVDELVAAGVENVCLCPGSRSTPLALSFARHPNIKLWTHLDERSCAYFALGMAKAYSVDPVVILCSSGTAAANFFPAVVEAFHSHAPLIVLTADRPPELQGLGSNQTIDQQNLYGSATKWFVNMPLPEASEQVLAYVRMVARRSFKLSAREGASGPVHLNFPFREPLLPSGHQPQLKPDRRQELEAEDKKWADRASAGTLPPPPERHPAYPGSLGDQFARAKRPLVVLGPNAWVGSANVDRLARRLQVPILADALSDARCQGRFSENGIIAAYDSFLRNDTLAQSLQPDWIIRFGAPPTSKPLATYLQRHRGVHQVQVAAPGFWPDPDLNAADIIQTEDPGSVLSELAEIEGTNADPGWFRAWQRAETASLARIREVLGPASTASEPSAITDLAEVLPVGYTVVAGNSMPVRDIDSFWPAGDSVTFFEGNRGASGIDGVVSTAMGVAARHGRVVLVIGDLSFYHDMNGLLAAQRFGLKATIVLINNDGGGIFSFLPQHEDAEHFETLFGTPHGLDFSHVAGLYGVGFQRVTTREEYRHALKASFDAPGVQIIEIKTDREENLRLHQRIWDEVAKAVAPLVTKEKAEP
jgi:2-succinyl-5-enolpyruvyl-6-hydroxy-3-cyclohexene-1-carboxylate synthase